MTRDRIVQWGWLQQQEINTEFIGGDNDCS